MNRSLLITCKGLIDGKNKELQEDVYLLIEDGVISKIGSQGDIPHLDLSQRNIDFLDYRHGYITPGIIDTHVHITFSSEADTMGSLTNKSNAQLTIDGVNNLQNTLKGGITVIRDLGAPEYIDIDIRNAQRIGKIPGPKSLVSGKFITMTGGHGWQIGRECDGIAEVTKGAREQLKQGADVLKIMATGGVLTPGVDPNASQLSEAEITAAVTEAHKAGKKTATHAQGIFGIKNAVRAGINSVEHGVFLDDEAADMMAERGTYLVPTFSAIYNIIKYGEEHGIPKFAVDKAKAIKEVHFESFQLARSKGVNIAMGTDAGTPFNRHGDNLFELKLMVDMGMTPLEAIQSSTYRSAQLLGIDDSHGSLEVGKKADFLLVKNNPLRDIHNLLAFEGLYQEGRKVL
ncbi:metal-dependent hydrolase family protein [Isachenkonia alkalipeptolytica]|uniref:Amidohydrolase family protein n=1 Tax=Isachenkonia alkalipeptolytica TaxID=2565777 RepID=A0AA43XKN0_9CLOT|nr:amidohydrolase family protein [Isachenkonia alkalipeptolytica]NBG88487.1 amidohydrolase family protein [Isachenkonia alkalipeptolytica]